MQQTQHVVDGIFAYRFRRPQAQSRPADLPRHRWARRHLQRLLRAPRRQGSRYLGIRRPGARQGPIRSIPRGTFTVDEWVAAGTRCGEYIHDLTGLPVFALGSSLGVAPAYSALGAEVFQGAILMGAGLIPGSPALANQREIYASEGVQQLIAQLGRAIRYDIDMAINFDQDYGVKGAGAEKKTRLTEYLVIRLVVLGIGPLRMTLGCCLRTTPSPS